MSVGISLRTYRACRLPVDLVSPLLGDVTTFRRREKVIVALQPSPLSIEQYGSDRL